MSGQETMAGHKTLLISSLYGMPCIFDVWLTVDGDWAHVNSALVSIGVETRFALVRLNLSTIPSM